MDRPAIAGGTPVREQFLVFGRPWILQPEIDEVVQTMRSGWLGTGPRTERFEELFCRYQGCARAVSFNSCTAGLHLSLVALGVGPGDEVVVPSLTFAATANVVVHCGAKVVLCDVERATQCLDPQHLAEVLTPRSRVVIPVHFAGRPCDLEAIERLCEPRGMAVLNDAAHAIETRIGTRSIGSAGRVTAYSFYVTKNLTTGEGGMVTTQDVELAERIRVLSQQGMTQGAWSRYSNTGFAHYAVVAAGYKYNMTDLQAAIGLHQLARLEEGLRRREAIWAAYDRAFAGLPCFTPALPAPQTRHARHLYTLLLDCDRLSTDRDGVLQALKREGIGAGVHYIALHRQPYYQQTLGVAATDFPHADWISERTVSLPLSPALSDQDVADVIAAVSRVLAYYER